MVVTLKIPEKIVIAPNNYSMIIMHVRNNITSTVHTIQFRKTRESCVTFLDLLTGASRTVIARRFHKYICTYVIDSEVT